MSSIYPVLVCTYILRHVIILLLCYLFIYVATCAYKLHFVAEPHFKVTE